MTLFAPLSFLGSIYNFVSLELMMRGRDPHPMPVGTFVRGLVDVLLDGASATAEAARPPSRPARKSRAK